MIYTSVMSLLSKLSISNIDYRDITPYPHYYQDNFLDEQFAKKLQEEILNIDDKCWDRYENCFEKKYTLRDKYSFPPILQSLFDKFTSEDFVDELSDIVGYKLLLDDTRNFWGVHKYKKGDKLDIHVDAGYHPTNGLKKQLTIGLYLSKDFCENNKCALEIWRGDNVTQPECKLYEKVAEISPLFNRFIMFTCNDYSWHGNPEPLETDDNDTSRIFITISYLSENQKDKNKYVKAYFIARPNDPIDEVKDNYRKLRVDPEKYKDVYRI